MVHFSSQPGNSIYNISFLDGISHSAPSASGAAAFVRSGIGEELQPGFFILRKDAALVVSALAVYGDLIFAKTEIEIESKGSAPREVVVQAVSDLLGRLAQRGVTERGFHRVGKCPATLTDMLETVLPDLPQFSKSAAFIKDAMRYVAQWHSVFVSEGARFTKADLSFRLLEVHCIDGPTDDMNLTRTFEYVRATPERAPDILARLQEEGIVPNLSGNIDPLRFWSEVFSHDRSVNNAPLATFIQSNMSWPDIVKGVTNDGIFLCSLGGRSIYTQGIEEPDAQIFDKLRIATFVCDGVTKIAEEIGTQIRVRGAGWN